VLSFNIPVWTREFLYTPYSARMLVVLAAGEPKIDDAPEGYRYENDEEFRSRLKAKYEIK